MIRAAAVLGPAFLLLITLAPAQITRRDSPQTEKSAVVSIPMRDGVRLAADLFLPGAGRWPTVLVMTPYGRTGSATRTYRYFLSRGYAVVIEDMRGRYGSRGVFSTVTQSGPDGNDTIDWIAGQAWSNGRVAMAGSSYLGLVQWWTALEDNPHLLAISPMNSGNDEYIDRYYSAGGALQLGHRLLWLAENENSPSRPLSRPDAYIRNLPLRTSDLLATGTIVPYWRSALDHPSYDDYWKQRSVRRKLDQLNVPVLSLGGWFDAYAESDLDAFSRLALKRKSAETWIGPWGHNPGLKFPTLDFGPQANIGIRGRQADWFDKWLKRNVGASIHEQPLLHIFIMGPNVWREEHEWPLARTRYTPLYLTSAGTANSSAGTGFLRWQPVRAAPHDSFFYDPKNPVPTVGGAICCEPKIFPPGPLNQAEVERRSDVLVYTSAPLNEEIEVTGPVRTILYISTSANDTDFTAKLVDVQPSGRPLLVTDGMQRLRYRLSLDRPVFVKRNQVYQVSVDCGVTSYVFSAGHRIRLEVSSSNFPRFDRSLNSTGSNADQTKPTKAKQTVFHEKGYPSAVILPVIPRANAAQAQNLSRAPRRSR
ncbi:MAG TPA: CocE/NonD family hydrolase [Bryobacteraceae bacterium]|nr:CocE/NonD family hydrolase [Bryobacteraceae bacterium]